MKSLRPTAAAHARLPLLLVLPFMLSACSISDAINERTRIDYKSAGKLAPLDVPPDLVSPRGDERFTIPERGQRTYSGYESARATARTDVEAKVLPAVEGMRVERAGTQRWLVVNQPADKLWPVVREFWQESGFVLASESPATGVMETEWAENRAKIPQDFIRNTIGKVFDSLWSTGERDMFRTRLERVGNSTEIYISHRGAQEVLTGAENSQTTWTSRPNDPGLEAEMLARLMVRLGADFDRAKAAVDRAQQIDKGAAPQLVTGSGEAGALQIAEPFDRAWRRVGLALDRGGFTVEDRNRAEGVYYVRYVDADAASADKPGFFGRLFGRGSDKPESRPQYRVKLVSSNDTTQVTVLDAQGNPETSATGRRILNVLLNQLK